MEIKNEAVTMMKLFFKICSISILCSGFILLISGCAGKINVKFDQEYKPVQIKKAYIVQNQYSKYIRAELGSVFLIGENYNYLPPNEDPLPVKIMPINETSLAIKAELEKYGIESAIGPGEEKFKPDIDIIVYYKDTWRWDFVKILDTLEISLVDAKSKRIFASGNFKIGNKHYHTFPSPRKEVPKIFSKLLNLEDIFRISE